jgi:hypothetical protein
MIVFCKQAEVRVDRRLEQQRRRTTENCQKTSGHAELVTREIAALKLDKSESKDDCAALREDCAAFRNTNSTQQGTIIITLNADEKLSAQVTELQDDNRRQGLMDSDLFRQT